MLRSYIHNRTDLYIDGHLGGLICVSYNNTSLPFFFSEFFCFFCFFWRGGGGLREMVRTLRNTRSLIKKLFCSAFAAGLNNGGASGLLYGYLFAWAGTVTQVLIMAELGSMYVFFKPQTPNLTPLLKSIGACFFLFFSFSFLFFLFLPPKEKRGEEIC